MANLWSCDRYARKIYQHSGGTATIRTSFASPGTYPNGITFGRGDLWSCDYNTATIYRHSGRTSTIRASFSSPGDQPSGLAWDNANNLWSCDQDSDTIYQHSGGTATITTSFSSPAEAPTGLTWDGTNLWSCDAWGADTHIYKHSGGTATITDSFASEDEDPWGLAWDESNNLWSIDLTSDTIYQHSGGTATITTSFSTPSEIPTGLEWDKVTDGAVAISSTAAVMAAATRKKNASSAISSIPSISIAGNYIASSGVDITAIASLMLNDIRARLVEVAISSRATLVAMAGPFIFARCSIGATSELIPIGRLIAKGSAAIAIVSSLIANDIALVPGAISIDAVSSVAAIPSKWKHAAVTITAVSSAEMSAIAYIIQSMGYTGTLTAGDVLVIDCDEQTVELNGANVTRYFTGEFPLLGVGANSLVWEDGGETPDLDFETKHKPRYL